MEKEITLQELEGYLNKFLNKDTFEEKAYNGAQIATKVPIRKIATAVSISKEVIQKAIDGQVQALIAHHGIFCKGDAHPLTGRIYEYVWLLITNNIALLCYHLPLDAHQELGNNWKAAHDLGLKNCVPFLKYGEAHIGVIGEVETMPFEMFTKKVEEYYKRSAATVKVHEMVRKVAIVSGSAERFIKEVAEAGADCFITGRVDEPVWDAAHEYGVSFLGLGHYATETVGPKALATHLQAHFKIPVVFLETSNPF